MSVAVATPAHMALEMAEQPAAVRGVAARRDEMIARIRAVLPTHPQGVALVGRGSSANAALVGRTLCELASRHPALLVSPSMERLYGARTRYHGWVAVALSQSGEVPEVVATAYALREAGAVAIGLTAHPGSRLGQAVDLCIDVGAGEERAVPTTKGFTAQVACLTVVAEALGGERLPAAQWQRCADATEAVLADAGAADEAAQRLRDVVDIDVIGAGMHLGVAAEVALKVQETALLGAVAHSAAGFRHGPIALAGREHPVVAVIGDGAAGQETRYVVAQLRVRGVPVLTIGEDGDLPVAGGLAEPLFAIPAAVRGQQVALALARLKGLDPDRPRGLRKVTRT